MALGSHWRCFLDELRLKRFSSRKKAKRYRPLCSDVAAYCEELEIKQMLSGAARRR